MKKILLLVTLILGPMLTQAQLIEDFENWNPFTVGFFPPVQLTEPVNWTGSDSFVVAIGKLVNPSGSFQAQIFEDNPGQSGMGALRAATKFQDTINVMGIANIPAKDYPAICSNSQFSVDAVNGSFSQVGGKTINFRPVSTTMFVKNTTVMGDSTFITALLIDNSDGGDSIVGIADTTLLVNINSFTSIDLPFTYLSSVTPTLVRYTISSGNPLALLDSTSTYSVHEGTEIVVDDINLVVVTGLKTLVNRKPIAQVYPTAPSPVLNIDFFKEIGNAKLVIYDLAGREVVSYGLPSLQNRITIDNLPSATYLYGIVKDGELWQTAQFVR